MGQLLPSVRCPGSGRVGEGAISSLALPGPATHHQLVLQPCRQHLFFPLSRSTFLAIFQGQFVACPLQKAQAQGEPGNNQRTSKLASNPVLQTPKKSLRTEVV